MRPISPSQAGQSLPLAMAGMIAILGMAFFMINAGRLLAARERSRMRTDVVALSSATLYARCLNIYALLKKVDNTAQDLAEDVGWFPFGGEVFDASYEAIDAAKNWFKLASPYGMLACTELLAVQNGLVALPYWNVKDFFDMGSSAEGLAPGLNYDKDESSSSQSSQSSGSSTSSHYSYRSQSSGQNIDVDNGDVSQDPSGGASGSYRDKTTGRFVHKDQGQDAKAEGEHSITLLTYDISDKNSTQVAVFKELPNFISISRARVSGGDFDIDSSKSLKWGCFLAPVTVKDPTASIPKLHIPETGISAIDQETEKANAALSEIQQWISRIPAILH